MSKYLTLLYAAFKHKSLDNFRAQCDNTVQCLKNNADLMETNESLVCLLKDYQKKYPMDVVMQLENVIAFYYDNIDIYSFDLEIQNINYPNISILVQSYNLTTVASALENSSYLDSMIAKIRQNMVNIDTSYLDTKIETIGDLVDFVEFMPLGYKVAHGLI